MDEGPLTAARVREALGLVPEDEFIALLDIIAERRAGDVFPFVERVADAGVDFGVLLTGLADMLRAQLAIVLGGTAPDLSEAARRALSERASALSTGDLLRMLSAVAELEPQFRKSAQQQVLVEMLLVRFALMDRTVELEDVLRAIGGGSAAGGGGGGGGGGGTGPVGRAAAPRTAAAAPAGPPRPAPRRDAAPAIRDAAPAGRDAAPVVEEAALVARDAPRAADAPAPRPAGAAVLADASPGAAPRPVPLDLQRVAERWDELVARMRAAGMGMLATALENGMPSAVSAKGGGEVVIRQEEANPFHAEVIEEKHAELLAVLREWFTGVARVSVSTAARSDAPKRLTDEMIRSQRLAKLRLQNPILGAAIDVLDLEVVD